MTETGQTFTSRTAHVRYGGLISTICAQPGPDEMAEPDGGREDALWLATLAHERVQDAAWRLRD